MSVYSNLQIRKAIANKHIVFHPFVSEHIRGSSIDMTLGEWYFRCERTDVDPMDAAFNGVSKSWAELSKTGIYNPFEKVDVERYFGDPLRAKSALHKDTDVPKDLVGIENYRPVIMIPGRSRILAHTHEFIGINPPGTSEMRARSSWGRNGIAVCLCAGWGDPGYINRWTMEIHNMNDEAVPIPVGERIAQLVFHETGAVAGSYGDGGGKYQESREIEEIVASWSPQQMLPRSFKDDRRLPLPV